MQDLTYHSRLVHPGPYPEDIEALGPPAPLLPASQYQPGAMVLSLQGTDRTALRLSVAMMAVGVLGVGFLAGYLYGRRRPR